MNLFKSVATAGLVAGAMLAAMPAQAVVTTFATYSAVGGDNLRLVNSGTNAARTTDATIFTISAPSSATPGAVLVNFSFLQPGLSAVATNISALYTLNATLAKNSPASNFGSLISQPGLSGTFSFVTTSAITFGSTFYAAGSNLLSGSFSNGTILGTGTSGASFASGAPGSTINFVSDFLDFSNTVSLDRAQSLTAVTPSFGIGANGALNSFRAVVGGQFSSDPAPLINGAVPEPGMWAMLIIGFGLVGGAMRRRLVHVTA